MKQVLLTLGLLLIAMVAFYWVSNRYKVNNEVKTQIVDKEIYFEIPESLIAETETEIKLKAKHENGILVSYTINFNYDPTSMKVIGVEVNKDIFDKKAEVKIDEGFGKVSIVGVNSKNRDMLTSGEILLATVKIKGLKKGAAMIYASRRPEVGILDGGKVFEGNFQMPNFKLNFL